MGRSTSASWSSTGLDSSAFPCMHAGVNNGLLIPRVHFGKGLKAKRPSVKHCRGPEPGIKPLIAIMSKVHE